MSKNAHPLWAGLALSLLILSLGAQATFGAVVPDASPVRTKEYRDPALVIPTPLVRGTSTARQPDLERLGVRPELAYLAPNTGRWATLIPTHPLIPGSGIGNDLDWSELERDAPRNEDELIKAARDAFARYLEDFAPQLRIDADEIERINVSVHEHIININVLRQVGNVPVRDALVTATLSQGNLILTGATHWADVTRSARPALGIGDAAQVLRSHLGDITADGSWGETELAFVPYQASAALDYRLVYSLKPRFKAELGNWEGLVDAHTGELLSFLDTNQYATRHVVGGVYPISNDGQAPDGVEQLGWPMPFASLNGGAGYTDSNGNFPPELDGPGEVTTDLDGTYIRIDDVCGDVSESSDGGDIDLGGSGGDDCTTPPGASPGNTHSARTTFYETNRIMEWARTRIPNNSWVNNLLVGNVNINASCNAFYSPGSINMYRSGGGCGNTGEIAGVIDHEWGHGMDQNDGNGLSQPSEGIPDIFAALRTGDSCIGRGFFTSGNCGGYGDPCIDCSGIRDIDFARRQSGKPHDPLWANSFCGGCASGTNHCRGAVYSEAVWDLRARDLQAEYGMDDTVALELTSWLTIHGSPTVRNWFSCNFDGEDGCAADGGYLNYIAADDFDGSLENGTPHMSAIYAAFDRHGIACSAPAVQDSGCEGIPTEAPAVTAVAGDSSASLSWDAVPGATRYHVLRTEGIKGCEMGKIYLGQTDGTSWDDAGLLNGTEFYYTVIPANGGYSCAGPASNCAAATPGS